MKNPSAARDRGCYGPFVNTCRRYRAAPVQSVFIFAIFGFNVVLNGVAQFETIPPTRRVKYESAQTGQRDHSGAQLICVMRGARRS
ncbi:hypothetical protein KCP69_08590 [Salmonella enterica subsp. enterica]|nr:hypothetical protein KCP69_08590 [Salmonella enterica subsp. enterica]